MKRLLCIFLVALSILSLSVPAFAATVNAKPWETTIKGNNVRVYQSPSTSSQSMIVPNGTPVKCEFKAGVQLPWVKITGLTGQYQGNVAYTKMENLDLDRKDVREGLFGSANLKQGDTGTAVGWLRAFLNRMSYEVTVGTTFDFETYREVEMFQADSGLTVDGIVGTDIYINKPC